MVVMTLTLFVLAASSRIMVALITQFKQQSKIAETAIEATVGIEIMRYDIKTAGFGLPWAFDAGVDYDDPAPAPFTVDSDVDAPRAFIINSGGGVNGSDELAIKSVTVGRNETGANRNLAAGKWHTIVMSTFGDPPIANTAAPAEINTWSDANENLADDDRVIVLRFEPTQEYAITLASEGGVFYTVFGDDASETELHSVGAPFAPDSDEDNRIIYGLAEDAGVLVPLAPFSSAGYFISTGDTPARCAPGTGVLVRAAVDPYGRDLGELPLLDCVADMKVFFALDGGRTGTPDGEFEWAGNLDCTADCFSSCLCPDNDCSCDPDTFPADHLTAEDIRERVSEVRVYVLAHDGQLDPTYTYVEPRDATPDPAVTEYITSPGFSWAFNFTNLETMVGNDTWDNYRWRVYRLSERTTALRGR
jgi:hypothetical protein